MAKGFGEGGLTTNIVQARGDIFLGRAAKDRVGVAPMSDTPATVIAKNLARVPIGDLKPHPQNPNVGDTEAIRESIRTNGFYKPLQAQRSSGTIITGHHSWYAAQAEGIESVPVVWLDVDDATALRIMLADNRIASLATIDDRLLADALASLDELVGTGYDDEALAAIRAAADSMFGTPTGGVPTDRMQTAGALMREFGVPPFSILDTRQGYWQARKREWLALGLRSELGRGEGLTVGIGSDGAPMDQGRADGTTDRGDSIGRTTSRVDIEPGGSGNPRTSAWMNSAGARPGSINGASRRDQDAASNLTGAPPLPDWADNGVENMAPGTSIFDPVLCELSYRWYSAPGASVLDPFAGGSVRGIVAGFCDRNYTGVDLRPEQVEANVVQWDTISARTPPEGTSSPTWVVGDSRDLDALLLPEERFDLIFSCPPYYDLEVYSDDPADLSRAPTYAEFLDAYQTIIAKAAERLADDRFAVLVVSEIRDTKGLYRGLIPDTIRACQTAGLALYNEAVLINMVGSLPLRARRQFMAARKLGRTHQAVLTFVKGSPEAATAWAGPVFVPELADEDLAPATGVAL